MRAFIKQLVNNAVFTIIHARKLYRTVVLICWKFTGGDKVPRKGGPGITQSDLLVINKTDLAEAVGADLKVGLHGVEFRNNCILLPNRHLTKFKIYRRTRNRYI